MVNIAEFAMGFVACIRRKVRIAEYISLEGLLLFNLVLGYVLFSALHLCGISAPRCSLMAATAVCMMLSLFRGWRFTALYFALFAFCLIATCFTFSYVDSDAITVHYPCQALLADGWNPIYERTPDAVLRYGVDGSRWAFYIAFMPKATAACGAMVAKTFGLFAGDAFLGYALCISLFLMSWRLVAAVWKSSGRTAKFVFAIAMTFSPQFPSVLSGKVDYTVHAAFAIACLSAALIWHSKDRRDYLVFLSSLVIAATSKALALAFAVYLMMCLGVVCRKSASVRWLLLAAVMLIVVCGFSPFFTAWATQDAIDITSDFVANADGARMGIVSRTIYAWFSKWFAVKGCAMVFSKPDFSPSLACLGGGDLEGFGTLFRVLMTLSVIALAFSKRTVAFWVAIFVFVASSLIPPKYIGYARYTPQMIIIPAIAFFNFAYAPIDYLGRFRCAWQVIRFCIVMFLICFHGMFCIRTAAIGVRYLATEADRQTAIDEIKAHGPINLPAEGNKYVLARRLRAGGVKISKDKARPRLPKMSMMMMIDTNDSEAREKFINSKYPFCFHIADFTKFHWSEALFNLPRPIYNNATATE